MVVEIRVSFYPFIFIIIINNPDIITFMLVTHAYEYNTCSWADMITLMRMRHPM